MVYVDADGVLADFESWVRSVDPEALKDPVRMCDLMVTRCGECFLESQPLPCGLLMDAVATDPDYYVLTAVPSYERMRKQTPYADDILVKALSVLKENKYRWFEQQGVPRNKVIVVDGTRGKFGYCCSGDVLYDDYQSSIDKWNSLGGIGIHVNRH